MASPIRVINGSFANVQGSTEVQQLIAKLPAAMKQRIQPALDQFTGDIVTTYKETAPVAPEYESHPGQMRDSAHVDDQGRELSSSVVVDAKDNSGKEYPAHVEYGHRTKSGGHVAAKPALWPAYQANKKKGRSRVSRAISQAVRDIVS